MTFQPSPPSPPAAPVFSAQDRADIAQTVREATAIGQQAQREAAQAMAQARRDMAQGAAGHASSVVKDPSGRIVVTGPDGRTITIDPSAGLNSDQISEMVQTALQPVRPEPRDRGPSGTAVGMVAIIFTFLFLMVAMLTRTVRRRPDAAGAAAALPPEAGARLARIEQAVEAVAIEVERISEAQRYSAQLLTDRLPGAAQTAPAVAARGDRA